MIYCKLAGGLLILFACAMLGRAAAQRLKNRVRTLEQLQFFLKTLSDRIRYSLEPLPEILGSASREDLGYVSTFAAYLAQELQERGDASFREVWNGGLDKFRRQLGISDATMHILQTLGKKIGTMTKEIEVGNIQLALDGVEAEAAKAREIYDKNAKVYRNLSILAGLLLILVFL